MSLSVSNFFAQCNMIAIGRTDAKISDISSIMINWFQLKLKLLVNGVPLLDTIIQIIRNNGMVIIGGFVNIEIVSAILSFLSSVSSYLFSVLMFFKPINCFPPLILEKVKFLFIYFFFIVLLVFYY